MWLSTPKPSPRSRERDSRIYRTIARLAPDPPFTDQQVADQAFPEGWSRKRLTAVREAMHRFYLAGYISTRRREDGTIVGHTRSADQINNPSDTERWERERLSVSVVPPVTVEPAEEELWEIMSPAEGLTYHEGY